MKVYNRTKIFRVLTWGGLGDVLLLTPTLRTLKQVYPSSKLIVYCVTKDHYALLKHNPHIDVLKRWRLVSAPCAIWARWVKEKIFKKRPWDGFIVPMWGKFGVLVYNVGHATSIIGEIAGIAVLNRTLDVFITHSEEKNAEIFMTGYKNPIIIQTTSISSPNKSWPKERWQALVNRNPELTFIQLGSAKDEYVDGVIDLRGKTSVRQSIALLKYARSFVVVESFLGHASNAVGTHGVVLFGPSAPHAASHPNNIALVGNPPRCSPCLEILVNSPCPYNRECMLSITVEEVECALRKQVLVG